MDTMKKLLNYVGSFEDITDKEAERMTKAEKKQYNVMQKEYRQWLEEQVKGLDILKCTRNFWMQMYDGIDNIGAERCLECLSEDVAGEEQSSLFICTAHGYNLQSFAEYYFNTEVRREIDKGNLDYCLLGYNEITELLDLSSVSTENPEDRSSVRDFAGMFYQLMQWELAVQSSEVLKRIPVKDLTDWLKMKGLENEDCLFLELGVALDEFIQREYGAVYLDDRSSLDLWSGPIFKMEGRKHRSAGHYMLYKQAEYHEDKKAMQEVMDTINIEQLQAVKIDNSSEWKEQADRIKKEAVYQHIIQNEKALDELKRTEDYEIVWCEDEGGIGLGICDPKRFDKKNWKGNNSYGRLLMEIRDRI